METTGPIPGLGLAYATAGATFGAFAAESFARGADDLPRAGFNSQVLQPFHRLGESVGINTAHTRIGPHLANLARTGAVGLGVVAVTTGYQLFDTMFNAAKLMQDGA